MKIAAALIKRIREDEYYSNLNKVFLCRNTNVDIERFQDFSYNPKADVLRKQDLQYLMKFMEKHLLGWWD